MAEIHHLIRQHGADTARRLAGPDADLVDLAATVLGDDSDRAGYTYSGFCLTSLPHRDPKTDVWRREGYKTTLLVQSGVKRDGSMVGLPFGATARLILIYLQTKAIQTESRVVDIGVSMHDWMSTMGLAVGGTTYKRVAEQGYRIAACSLTFYRDAIDGEEFARGSFVSSGKNVALQSLFATRVNPAQRELIPKTVELDEHFYNHLRDHPVPIQEAAVRELSGNSMAIDVYVWLAYRLHAIPRKTSVPWPALYGQFGGSYKELKQFKPEFRKAVRKALAAYPDARVEEGDGGLILQPSVPPVVKRTSSRSCK